MASVCIHTKRMAHFRILNKFIVYCNITSCRLVKICNVWTVPRNFLVRVKRSITRNYFSLTTCCLTLKLEALQSLKILVFNRRNGLIYQNTCLQHHRCEHLKTTNILKTKWKVQNKSHTTSASRSEHGPVKYTQQNICVCVLWEVAGRAPFEGGTWNNVVIEIITVHTKKVSW